MPTPLVLAPRTMFEKVWQQHVVASPEGKQLPATGLRYELLRVERRYQYYRRDGRWEYEPVKSTRRTAGA